MKIAVLSISNDDANKRKLENLHHLLSDVELLFLFGYPGMTMSQSYFYDKGWKHWAESKPGNNKDQMIIASRSRFVIPQETGAAERPDTRIKVYLPEHDTTISGIDFPKSQDIQVHDFPFQKILKIFKAQNENREILIGDFKIYAKSLNTILDYKHYFQEIASLGWSDAWRTLHPITYEQIWYGNVQRQIHLNLVFLSPFLRESLLSAYHCQYSMDNKQTRTDSRVLVVELA